MVYLGLVVAAIALGAPGAPLAEAGTVRGETQPARLLVTNDHDAGPGSLRQAILDAAVMSGPQTIAFDHERGPFRQPQTIVLRSALPELGGELTIDGRIDGVLWAATGVTVNGAGQHRVFAVTSGARVTLRAITIADAAL